MIIDGVDVDDLEAEYTLPDNGKVLIIDGDGPAYRAAGTVKTVPTGIRRFQTIILEQLFLADCSAGEVFLTHEECYKTGRYNIKGFKPYQGQRSGGAKPPLLQQVREGAYESGSMDEFTVHMETVVEADDAMMMLAYSLGERGVIRSDDKDLRMTPYPYYDIKRGIVIPSDPFGRLWMDDETGKCLGHSIKFFWAQMLMGDTADNVRGLDKYNGKNIGPRGAFDLLDPITDIEALCNTVISGYRLIDQNPIAEGWLLWMLRSPTDNVWNYFNELPFSRENSAFLADCVRRDWFIK